MNEWRAKGFCNLIGYSLGGRTHTTEPEKLGAWSNQITLQDSAWQPPNNSSLEETLLQLLKRT